MTQPIISTRSALEPGHDVEITSYGVLHGEPPALRGLEAVEVDLTTALRNPHHDPAMRQLTGLDQVVYDHVMATEGAAAIVEGAVDEVTYQLGQAGVLDGPVEVLVFCKGGRHRSVSVAIALRAALAERGVQAGLTHRDVAKPVVQS